MDGTSGGTGERGKRGGKQWCQKGLGGRRARMDLEGRKCKILQPRGTHGDVISRTENRRRITILTILQPRSHSVSMYEWLILLGLSLGKSLSIPITAPLVAYPSSSRSSRVPAAITCDGYHPDFCPSSFTYLPTYTDGFTEQRFHFSPALRESRWWAPKVRGGGNERFLRCRFLSL